MTDIYEKYRALGGEDVLEFGPGHIVWSDENWGDGTINRCIGWCDTDDYSERFSKEEIALVRQSLVELLAIPESVRECEPADYDGQNPANFPPTIPVRRVSPHPAAFAPVE